MTKNFKIGKYLLLLAAIGMIGIGAARGELETVVQKAIHICLECIGVG